MPKMLLTLVLCLLALPEISNAAPAGPYPEVVVQRIYELANACKAAGGGPHDLDHPPLLQQFDVNNDGQLDWLVDSAGFGCSGNPQLFRSPAGARIDVFVATTGGARRSFSGVAYEFHVTGSAPAQILVTLKGKSCARRGPPSATCERLLVWNERKKRLALGSPSAAAGAVPAATAVKPTQSSPTRSHADVEAWANAHYNTSGNEISALDIFEGDFTGDGAADAIAFIHFSCEGCGNSDRIFVALFRNQSGRFKFYREAPGVFGASPRDAAFSTGRIEVTTTMPNPGDARCCPTGKKRWTIPTN